MNVTAENITCRKCRAAGLKNFVRRNVYVEGGAGLDVISCLICSTWYCSRPLSTVMEREVPEVKERKTAICQAGCGNLISAIPGQNKTGLCTACGNRLDRWRRSGEKGLPPLIRTPTGYITRAAYLAAQPQEDNHAEVTQELPRLAPPASPAPAVRNPARHPAQLRRDDHEGVVGSVPDLQQLLADIGLPTPAETVRSWSLAEWSEVHAWAKATQAKRSSRRVPPMPDILCPIYDALYVERSA